MYTIEWHPSIPKNFSMSSRSLLPCFDNETSIIKHINRFHQNPDPAKTNERPPLPPKQKPPSPHLYLWGWDVRTGIRTLRFYVVVFGPPRGSRVGAFFAYMVVLQIGGVYIYMGRVIDLDDHKALRSIWRLEFSTANQDHGSGSHMKIVVWSCCWVPLG